MIWWSLLDVAFLYCNMTIFLISSHPIPSIHPIYPFVSRHQSLWVYRSMGDSNFQRFNPLPRNTCTSPTQALPRNSHHSIWPCIHQVLHIFADDKHTETVHMPQRGIGTSSSFVMTWWWCDVIRPSCTCYLYALLSPAPGPKPLVTSEKVPAARFRQRWCQTVHDFCWWRNVSCEIMGCHIKSSCNVRLSIY